MVIKGDAFAKPHIMETYSSQADNLYQEANEIEYPDYIPFYTNCYESLLEFEGIISKAREMENAARDIRKKFQEIATSGLLIPFQLYNRTQIKNCTISKQSTCLKKTIKLKI